MSQRLHRYESEKVPVIHPIRRPCSVIVRLKRAWIHHAFNNHPVPDFTKPNRVGPIIHFCLSRHHLIVFLPFACFFEGFSGHDRSDKFEDDRGANCNRENHFLEVGQVLTGQ